MLKLEETTGYLEKMNKNLETPVIVVTGMHRSGTSLVAALLQSVGVNIGQRLMEPGEGNIKGHFEDLDLVEFHENILKSQGFSKQGWITKNKITVHEQYISQARHMIKIKETKGKLWGWKDPRTTLFLDFWKEQIPNIFYIFVFRSPWEVIDSLYRRGDEVFLTNPNFAIDIWENYNKIILDFQKKNPYSCCLFNIESIIENSDYLISSLEKKLSIRLDSPDYCYDEVIFNRQLNNSHRPTIIKNYFSEAWTIYENLCSIDAQNEYFNRPNDSEAFDNIPDVKAWVLQDWIDVKISQKFLKQVEEKNHILEEKIAKIKEEMQREKIKNQQLENQISEKDYLISIIKESRFWKLREFWFKIKKRLIPFL